MALPINLLGSPPTVTPQAERQLEGFKMSVLPNVCESPRDRPSIQTRLGLKDRKDLQERYLAPALAAGWLAMTDPEHPSSHAQKDRTTSEGLTAIAREKQDVPT